MRTFTVTAKQWKRGWELHIEDVGVTQARRLNRKATDMARDFINRILDIPIEEISLEWRYDFTDEQNLGEDARAAQAATREAAAAQKSAAVRIREVAGRLRSHGVTGREAATILGMSPQRYSQLTKR